MKITDVSCVQSLRFSNIIIIDCNHEDIYKNEFRHEIFVLGKNNEQIAHFESNHCIRVADLDEVIYLPLKMSKPKQTNCNYTE